MDSPTTLFTIRNLLSLSINENTTIPIHIPSLSEIQQCTGCFRTPNVEGCLQKWPTNNNPMPCHRPDEICAENRFSSSYYLIFGRVGLRNVSFPHRLSSVLRISKIIIIYNKLNIAICEFSHAVCNFYKPIKRYDFGLYRFFYKKLNSSTYLRR